ncbi:hypothetical protein BLA29_011809, partial [Euroglyphus maynei]
MDQIYVNDDDNDEDRLMINMDDNHDETSTALVVEETIKSSTEPLAIVETESSSVNDQSNEIKPFETVPVLTEQQPNEESKTTIEQLPISNDNVVESWQKTDQIEPFTSGEMDAKSEPNNQASISMD